MKSKITVKLKLTWSGGIEFLDDCMFPSEWNRLLKDSDMPDYVRPILMPNLSIERLRYRYIKQIEEEILDGNLDGTLQIGRSELNWVWKPEFFIDDEEVSFHNIKDQIDIDELTAAVLDGADKGVIDYPVEYHIQLDVTARSGKLAMGDVIIETYTTPDVYVNCAFASDGRDVIFDDAAELPESSEQTVKQKIIRMILEG